MNPKREVTMARFISRQQAARLLDVTDQTVSNWISKGVIMCRMVGSQTMIDRTSIEKYFDTLTDLSSISDSISEERRRLETEKAQLDADLSDCLSARRLMGHDVPERLFYGVFRSLLSVASETRLPYRSAAILSRLLQGQSLDSVSKEFDLSRERILQVVNRACFSISEMEDYDSLYESCRQKEHDLDDARCIIDSQKSRIAELEKTLEYRESARDELSVRCRKLLGPDGGEITKLLSTRIVDMKLTTRSLNCLRAADIKTLGQLVSYKRSDLLKFRNFGEKSFIELDDIINSLGLSWGMDVGAILAADYELKKKRQEGKEVAA